LTATDTTFDGNSADNCPVAGGGAIHAAGFGNPTVLISSTVADNTADGSGNGGGGILEGDGDLQLYDTIVARNTKSGVASDVAGTANAASSFNLIGTGGAGGLQTEVHGNVVGVASPGLGTVGNNGGFAETVSLVAGSPALDAGSASISGVEVPPIDQRGAQRGPAGLDAGTGVDIGAYEASSSYLVTRAADDGTLGTLRFGLAWAGTNVNPIAPAGTANIVRFDTSAAGPFATPQTIALTLGALEIPGNGSSTAVVHGTGPNELTVTGNSASRVFLVDANATVTLEGLTITGVLDMGFGGGGIYSSGTLSVIGDAITSNVADGANFGAGGGIYNNSGTLNVVDSTIAYNSATGLGGGGILHNAGSVSIVNSTIFNYAAINAFYGGGAIA
jgi:hypothetical protein